MRRIGILGGMGPEATLLIMRKTLEAVDARDDADHLPLIVDQNPQVPSRIAHLIEGTGTDPTPVLVQMAERLERAGAEGLALPCNTAHYYAGAIRRAASVPFIDMVQLSVRHAAILNPGEGRVGILASPAVRKTALFEKALAAEGLTPVYPNDEDALLEAIRRIKAMGDNPASRNALAAASTDLVTRNAAVQMIACTEFSLIAGSVASNARAFDTLDCLVRAMVAFATQAGAVPQEEAAKATGNPTDQLV